MLPERLHWVIEAFEPEGDPWLLLQIALDLEVEGNLEGAAAIIDRAYGLEPSSPRIRQARAGILDGLAVEEHGLVFRYVPGGPFLMGNPAGEIDEQPLHPVWLSPYWMAEVPLSWTDYCRLLDWRPPPDGRPRAGASSVYFENQVRQDFCAEHTGGAETSRRRWFGGRQDRYDTKPLVAVNWQSAEELARKLSTPEVRYALPTEAQWEKAARGGLIGALHPWGDDPPSSGNCDFGNYHAHTIQPSRAFPPNGYELYAMCGGVWEWTADWYDRDRYRHTPLHDPPGPESGEERVLRGGSWSDCAETVSVSFRMSRTIENGMHRAANLGFRLCRCVPGQRWP
jgi:formylglycine-generating enzyme required for sulfatase activity